MKLSYVAFDKAGRQVVDAVEAADVAEAKESLRRKGLYVTQIGGAGSAAAGAGAAAPRAGLSNRRPGGRRLKDVAMMLRQMHALVSCGTPQVQALGALERQASPGAWQNAVRDLRTQVEEGAPLSSAMERHPQYFDSICRGLIAAGESSGDLPAMLDRLAVMTRRQLHTRSVVIGAMIYPSLLMVIAVSVLVLMILFVVPRFGDLFDSLGVALPPSSQALVTISALLWGYWWAALILTVGPLAGLIFWQTTENGRSAKDRILLHLPQVGKLMRGFITARIARLLGTLLESHVGVLDALALVRQAAGNQEYAALVDEATEAVTRGESISRVFGESRLISPAVYEALHNGEQSGQVGPMLLNIADFLDEENEVVIRSLTSIIEPVILLIMGMLVGLVAVSMFMPLFDLTSMTQGGG
jgi:type II secretory pathway component PulF